MFKSSKSQNGHNLRGARNESIHEKSIRRAIRTTKTTTVTVGGNKDGHNERGMK